MKPSRGREGGRKERREGVSFPGWSEGRMLQIPSCLERWEPGRSATGFIKTMC